MRQSGNTMECLQHYLKQLPRKAKGCEQAWQPLADFIGVTKKTIRRWSVGSNVPLGLPLIKLRYFLEARGYRIAELDVLERPIHHLGALVALGKIDCEETSKLLGYSAANYFFQVLHGKRGLSSNRMATVEEICSKHPLPALPATSSITQPICVAAQAGRTIVSNDVVEEEVLNLLRSLDGLSALMTPRLEHMLTDGFTSAQRQFFRDRAGRQLVFDLANRFYVLNKLLNALCSEKAREIGSSQELEIQNQKKKRRKSI